MLLSCAKQETEWKGMIEEENGVQVVKNPKEPMYAEDVFSLEEELALGGADEREEYMFSEIRQIDVDENERMYVLDWQADHIKVFDKNGEYLLTIGSRGQGPGELDRPSMISIKKNELMVTESRRLSFFSLDGKFLNHVLTKDMRPARARIGSQGHIIVEESIFDPENPRYQLKVIDNDMNLISEIASSPTFDPQKPFNPFMSYTYWLINKDENIVYGFQADYELKIYDQGGTLLKKVKKEYDPVEITEEEKEERTEGIPPGIKVEIPKYHTAFYRFFLDDEGRIFVQTYEKIGEEIYYHDVFDHEGKHTVKIPLRMRPFLCKKGNLYSVEDDEEGYQVVKRYKITWNY
jgi:hypothetical protein